MLLKKKKKKDAKADCEDCFHLSLGVRMVCAAECTKGACMGGPARGDVFWCIQQHVVAVPGKGSSQRGK